MMMSIERVNELLDTLAACSTWSRKQSPPLNAPPPLHQKMSKREIIQELYHNQSKSSIKAITMILLKRSNYKKKIGSIRTETEGLEEFHPLLSEIYEMYDC
jgi:hypothetical protein